MQLCDEKFVSFTTFRKNGEAKSTPVWIVDLGDGTLAFTTPEDSWKVTRLANNDRVRVQPCDGGGTVTPGSTASKGTAVVVRPDEPRFDVINDALTKKYGMQRRLAQIAIKSRMRFGGPANVAIVITLDAAG